MSIASSGASPDDVAPVAVVIPCYRARATLRRALDSVLRQTLPPRELIVVDDASGDGSWEELQRIQEEIGTGEIWAGRLRLIRLDRNLGPSGARNAGWEAATSELIAFLDADDDWHPRKLELQVRFMREHPEFDLTGHLHAARGSYAELPAGLPYVEIGARELLRSNRFVTPSVMLRRSIAERFRDGQRHMEDHLLWMQLALRGRRLARIELELASLYKPQFGAAGQSAELWAMESAELSNYRQLRREGLIGSAECGLLSLWSGAKYLRRLAIVALRRGYKVPARFGHLQQLRAIAALMVVMQHARFAHYPEWGGERFGTLGVDLFFVISGFVIFWVTRNETSFARYLVRRIVRIVPLYWMLTLLVAATVLLFPQVFRQTVFDLGHFIQSLAFVPAVNPSRPETIQPLLTPGWTLNYEFFFYLAFGLVFFLFRNLRWRLALFSVLLLGLVVTGKVFAPTSPVAVTYTSPQMLEFVAGVWIGAWIDRGSSLPGKRGALAFFFAGWLCLMFEPMLLGWGALLGASMVVLGAVALERVWRCENRLMEFLGDASYSIYLTHVLFLGAFRHVWTRVPGLNGMPYEPVVFMLAGIVLSTCAGALVYLAFERPVQKILGRLADRRTS